MKNYHPRAYTPLPRPQIAYEYFPEVQFFTEVERFEQYLQKLRHRGEQDRVHYLSICSPNHLHEAHVRVALRLGARAICEKPLVISPAHLDQLAVLEADAGDA